MLNSTKNEICNLVKSRILIDQPLKKHTTFGVGGLASLFIYPNDIKDLKVILKYSSKNKIKIFFMGSGSNLLISDNGFDGIILCLKKSFKHFELNDCLEANIGTGVMLGHIVRTLTKKSVLNLGRGGSGTLIEYAILREYMPENVKNVSLSISATAALCPQE